MKLQLVLPIHTYPDGNADAIAVHGAAIARHLEADLHALVQIADFPRVSSALGNLIIDVPAMIRDAKAKCHARGKSLVQALEAEAKLLGISVRVTEVDCLAESFGDAVAVQARYHDFIILGVGATSLAPMTAEAAIFGSGRPTLLVPEKMAATPSFQHVMIAWDGSRVAARAVADSLEFLRRANLVTIASVIDEKKLPDTDPGDRLRDYLAHHDIEASVARVEGGSRPISETLQGHARAIGADMLVMGAFGHSRVRDFVLGGATSGILKELRMPTLLSH